MCGQYPTQGHQGQSLTLADAAVCDVVGASAADMRGGCVFTHNVTLSGTARMRLRGCEAPCGAAIAAIDAQNLLGGGYVTAGAGTVQLLVEDARELNASLGCLSIEANLQDQAGRTIQQPCSGCAAPGIPPPSRAKCRCGGGEWLGGPAAAPAVRECCHARATAGGG
jgi:hypothetical protein